MDLQSVKISLATAGHQLNALARRCGRDLERITRPFKWNERDFEPTFAQELMERTKRAVDALFSGTLSLIGLPLSILAFSLGQCVGGSRLDPIGEAPYLNGRRITVLSMNACLQEGPFASLTGGMVPPSSPAGGLPSRTAALAAWIGNKNRDVYLGQEFHDLGSQEEFIKELRKYGYSQFIADKAPHAIYNNSGLFAASKIQLTAIHLDPFPFEDRHGLAKGTQQGVLAFSVADLEGNEIVRLLNTHLNYGDGPKNQAARNRQIRNHIAPLLTDEEMPTVLFGDLNCNTKDPQIRQASGLNHLVNWAENSATCTNEGSLHLRGEKGPLKEESLDGMIPNSNQIAVSDFHIEKVVLNDSLLSDHYAIEATLDIA